MVARQPQAGRLRTQLDCVPDGTAGGSMGRRRLACGLFVGMVARQPQAGRLRTQLDYVLDEPQAGRLRTISLRTIRRRSVVA